MTIVDNINKGTRLFLGNLPKLKSETEICDEVGSISPGLIRAITYKSLDDPDMHRGFCFLDYETPEQATQAKERLSKFTVFGCKTIVDWADPEPELDEETMRLVRILFVRQTPLPLTERALAEIFNRYGRVERVKTLKNFAFVHFAHRMDAQAAMDALNGSNVDGSGVRFDISWAKPPADKKTREKVLRDRERRMQASMIERPKTYRASSAVSDNPRSTPSSSTGLECEDTNYAYYDHYRYDFSRPLPFACQPHSLTSLPSSCLSEMFCPCGLNSNDVPPEKYDIERSSFTQPKPKWDVTRSHCDRGDGADNIVPCQHHTTTTTATANDTDIDRLIIKFFHKVSVTGCSNHTQPCNKDLQY
ncbi:heterogeneous nuclear ribonucleoprotein R-like [Daktulosphaira vitifoliae]|uniref:heterogeneous nuclear ribonucleoprotein R-like n=1 Tax=Daktulosphaira vitifoliae TaxID=58002 RepID=UPI0021AAD7F9|nr:heterogeneous nuclear ribonucleoprotein R-like [Daktulosphaira vitifoliae]